MASSDRGSSEFDIDYQYPDEQGDSDGDFDFAETTSENKASPLSRLPKKKIMLLIGMGIVLFAVFQVLTPKDEESERVPQPTSTPQVVQEQPETTTQEAKGRTQVATQTLQQSEIQLAPVQVSTADTTQIQLLQSQMQEFGNEVVELKGTISALIRSLEIMAGQVQELRQAQQTSPATFMPFKPKDPYFLKAVIPGRAWLESLTGNLITVKEGDLLSEYGSINKIDANEGWVETGSGLVITYGENDS